MSSNTDPELLKKLIDNDHESDKSDFEDVEFQKVKHPVIIKGVAVSSSKKKKTVRFADNSDRSVRGGCPCWCKCIGWTVLVFTLFGFISLGFLFFWLVDTIDYAVENLTVETSQTFPVVQMSDTDLDNVAERIADFIDELASPGANHDNDTSELIVTQDEINGFISQSDYLRGNMMVTLHKDLIKEELSLPMDILGFDNRYFVASDYLALTGNDSSSKGENKDDDKNNLFEMKMETAATHEDWFEGPLFFARLNYLISKNKDDEGRTMIDLFLKEGSFFGLEAPEDYINKHENLLEELYNVNGNDDVEEQLEYARSIIANIERVSVEEGEIVVKKRDTVATTNE